MASPSMAPPRYTALRQIAKVLDAARKYGGLAVLPIALWFGIDRSSMSFDLARESQMHAIAERELTEVKSDLERIRLNWNHCEASLQHVEAHAHQLELFHVKVQHATIPEILKIRFDPIIN